MFDQLKNLNLGDLMKGAREMQEKMKGMQEELASNKVSCASAGCHGVAHRFSKRPEELGE